MATEEFIPYIISELGDRVGVALGTSNCIGKGGPGENDLFKAEAFGELKPHCWQNPTPRR